MKMTPRSYSSGELLHMRQAPSVDGLAYRLRSLLREDVELNDIAPKPSEKHTERKLSRIPEENRETSGDSNEPIPMKRVPVRQLDGTESEWKYRGRTESEEAEPQPISAPTGLAAQKDEGFQRFYKAVVSPTHVRVTAGGRIVPNNRCPASPTTKWPKDKTEAEGTFAPQFPQRGDPEQNAFPLPQGHFGSYPPPLYPGFVPGINPAMAPAGHHYPFMPWPLGMNMGGSFAIPMAAGNQMPPTNQASNKPKEGTRKDKQSGPGVPDKANHAYTSPEQFDHSRPGFYNGQWMMPAGGHFYPFTMAAPHGFPTTPFPIPMMATSGTAPNPAPPITTAKPNHSAETDAPGSTSKAAPAYTPSSKPPVSSIRPSEITKRHLDILRTRLKYLEDQLSYNKHQIDERTMENDAQMVRQYIEQFEKNFEVQVSIEESQCPKPSENNGLGESAMSNGGAVSKPSSWGEAKSHSGNHASSDSDQVSLDRITGRKSSRDKTISRFNAGINSTKSTSAFAGWKALSNSSGTSDQVNCRSTLPVGAAMAAPFQPRAEVSTARADPDRCYDRMGGDAEVHTIPVLPDDGKLANGKVGWTVLASQGRRGDPYLVGHLPYGVRPDLAKDTDYTYPRPLTEDELRARHMYWGKAPRHLQKGLPKFNGKDFFPPSPVKGRSSDETSSTFSMGDVPFIDTSVDSGAPKTTASSDPFQALGQSGQILTRNGPGHSTQSEALPRRDQGSTENLTSSTNRSMPYGIRVGRSLDELNRCSQETVPTSSDSLKEKSSSDEAEDDRELIFTGRRAMTKPGKIHNEIWSTMLKKGATSANAIPGAVSSTTARGVLPHYAGHATASLTPTIANQALSPRSPVPKAGDQGEIKASSTSAEKRGENCPPCEVAIDEPF